MMQLSAHGQQVVNDIAQRHGFSPDAVASMLQAVINGRGGMAQFDHPEFGGSGQWMRGGMTMVADMFNNQLKGRVDALCEQLAGVAAGQSDLVQRGSFQSQSQGHTSAASLYVPARGGGVSDNWWPSDLGPPNSTGGQNDVRYAYFGQARRLAIDVGGQVTVYDALDHQIGGVSQQQSGSGSLTFTSQHGLIDVATLPVISGAHQPHAPRQFAQQRQPAHSTTQPAQDADIFATIEKLAGLNAKGFLSDEEFRSKKAELLARL